MNSRRTDRIAVLAAMGMLAVLTSIGCSASVEPQGLAQGVEIGVTPLAPQVLPGSPVQFAAVVTGTAATAVQWSVTEVGGGSVDQNGLYVAPPSTGIFHVVARLAADPTQSASAAVTVTPTPIVAVSVTPSTASVWTGYSLSFSAMVTGTSNTAVTWTVREGASGGSVTSSGFYRAPPSPGTFHIDATSAADPTRSGTAVVTVTDPPAGGPTRYLGVNLTWAAPYTNGAFMWADALKSARPWTDSSNNLIALDADGWPTAAARIGFYEGFTWPSYYATSGYKLRFRGPANCVVGGSNVTVTNLTAPDGNGYRTADVRVNGVNNTWLDFSTAVREVSLTRPDHVRGVDYWNKDFLAAIAPFSMLRTMQTFGPGFAMWGAWTAGVMANRDTTWASRVKPGTVGYGYNGPSWEEFVILANLTGKDIWVNLPFNVDSDYVSKVAQLLRFGSDAATKLPYTTNTHDPATWDPSITTWYPGLLPGRNVYVEFNNEIWNYLGSGNSEASAEIAAGDPHHLNFDGRGAGDRWVAWKTVWMSQLFRQVWGDSSMGSRVRIVLANQGDWTGWWRHQQMLDYLTSVWGAGSAWNTIDGFANPKQPVAYYVHDLSGSFYLHWNSPGDVDTGFSQLNTSLSTPGGLSSYGEYNCARERIKYGQAMAAAYGVKFSTYEAGVETMPATGGVSAQADADPRMRTLFEDLMHAFYAEPNADVYVHFWLVGNTNIDAGLSTDFRTLDTQRWQAVKSVAAGL
jgi:hypothetical protein